MRLWKIVLLSAALLILGGVVGGICAWAVRGAWDEHFMLEGRFHVVSLLDADHEVTIRFPSRRQVTFTLEKGRTTNFRLTNTGEGSIEVLVDGALKERVGYVTSMNSQVVLVVAEDGVSFSQVFPSLNTEPTAPPEPPPRASVSDAPADRTLDSQPAADPGGGR